MKRRHINGWLTRAVEDTRPRQRQGIITASPRLSRSAYPRDAGKSSVAAVLTRLTGVVLLSAVGLITSVSSAHASADRPGAYGGVTGSAAPAPGVDVGPLWLAWAIATAAVLAVGVAAGRSLRGSFGGILIDGRGRYSLARFHIVWWSAIILPLVAAVIVARFTAHRVDLLAFTIPAPVLALLGVSVVTTIAATGVKARKDELRADAVAGAVTGDAQWAQMVSVEEGEGADNTVDVGKVQSLVVTLLLGMGYVLTVIHEFSGNGSMTVRGPADLTSLPDLDATFVVLLGVSSAAYVGSKTINRAGSPTNDLLTVRNTETTMLGNDIAAGLDVSPAARVRRRRAHKRTSRAAARTAAGQQSQPQPDVATTPAVLPGNDSTTPEVLPRTGLPLQERK